MTRAPHRHTSPASAVLSLSLLVVSLGLSPSSFASPPYDDLPSPEELEESEESEESEEVETADDQPSEAEAPTAATDDPPAAKREAAEPRQPATRIKTLSKPKWIKHVIVSGERLDEIADRYRVRKSSLIRWNKLDKKNPKIYAGRKLSVYTKYIPPPQEKTTYVVQRGDTWAKIAKAHGVDSDTLRTRWNSKVPRKFKAGQKITIWVDPLIYETADADRDPAVVIAGASAGTSAAPAKTAAKAATAKATKALPLVAIPKGSLSVGKPNKGRISSGVKLPENKQLYTVRKPDESYGSSHALYHLQLAIATFRRDFGYTRTLSIGALSKKGGGRIKPHSSHQSGRDVDIRLPIKKGINKSVSDDASDHDWDATWALIHALIATGEVEKIFLSHSRQKHLYKAAKKAGASKDTLERVIQYPSSAKTIKGIVRNSSGHTAHIHVRFRCGPKETQCETYK